MTRRAAQRFEPKPPLGVTADAFQHRVLVPTVLIRAVGPEHAAVLATLICWNDQDKPAPTDEDWLTAGITRTTDQFTETLRVLSTVGEGGVINCSEPGQITVRQEALAALINETIGNDTDAAPPDPETVERRAQSERLCRLLADLIQARGLRSRTITSTWLRDMEMLIRIDGRTSDQIERAILWCQSDPFWDTNIESPGKLRLQFDKLKAAASREGTPAAKRKMDRSKALLAGASPRVAADPLSGTLPSETISGSWHDEFGPRIQSTASVNGSD